MEGVLMMDALKVLLANFEAEDDSFLYHLHEECCFHEEAFSELCGSISSLCRARLRDNVVSGQIAFIYGQVLRHIIYHFDPNDLSRISNLPRDYNGKLEDLEYWIAKYFAG